MKVWVPGMPRTFGLEHGGTTRRVAEELESTGFGDVDLPVNDWEQRRRLLASLVWTHRTLTKRFAPVPVYRVIVNKDPEGDGPYLLFSLGEPASFEATE